MGWPARSSSSGTSATGRPTSRSTSWSPTPPSSGSPATSTCCPRLVGTVAPGGWFAFAVPGNFAEPSHTLRQELAAEEPYAAYTAGVATPAAHDAVTYLEALTALGCEVDAWESTYLHVLTGEDPVFDWISGTSLRPTVQALPEELRPEFEAELRRRLREVYPPRDGRVTLPFRRVFATARIPA